MRERAWISWTARNTRGVPARYYIEVPARHGAAWQRHLDAIVPHRQHVILTVKPTAPSGAAVRLPTA